MMIDIHAELYRAQQNWRLFQAFQPAAITRLATLGLDPAADTAIGGIGIENIRVERKTWVRDPAGAPAVIIPVWDGPANDPAIPGWHPSPLIDLVAWRPSEPAALPTRLDIADAINPFALFPALADDIPIRIYRSPATWRGDPDGIVVIDWRGCDALLGRRQVIAEDVEHGDEIKKKLELMRERITPKVPPIGVPASRIAA